MTNEFNSDFGKLFGSDVDTSSGFAPVLTQDGKALSPTGSEKEWAKENIYGSSGYYEGSGDDGQGSSAADVSSQQCY